MSKLTLRNVDIDLVKSLNARAALEGTSAEALHRKLLEEALLQPKKKSLGAVLQAIPAVGKDSDFERISPDEKGELAC